MGNRLCFLLAFLILLTGLPLTAIRQTATLAFDVASVKRSLPPRFDGDVTFAPEPLPGFPPPSPTSAAALVTALSEQLGLKLEPGRGLVEVLVVDTATHGRLRIDV